MSKSKLSKTLENAAPILLTILFCLCLLAYTKFFFHRQAEPGSQVSYIRWIYSSLAASLAYILATISITKIIADSWSHAPKIERNYIIAIIAIVSAAAVLITRPIIASGGLASELLHFIPKSHDVRIIVSLHSYFAIFFIAAINLATYLTSRNLCSANANSIGTTIRQLRNLMYAAAVTLAFTVIQFNSLLLLGAHSSQYDTELVSVYSLGTGLTFSLLVTFILGPASISADQRLGAIMSEAANEAGFTKEQWLTRHNISDYPLQHLQNLVGYILPLLGAFAAGLLPGHSN